MTWLEFESKLETREMLHYFDFLDVDPSDARSLFAIIDTDNSGTIDCEEFLNSCLRLKGPAKALDHQVLMREVTSLAKMVGDLRHQIDEYFAQSSPSHLE